MPLRLLEITLPDERVERLGEWPGDRPIVDAWTVAGKDRTILRALVDARYAETVVDEVVEAVGPSVCRVVSVPVEATLPRVDDSRQQDDEEGDDDERARRPFERVSRDELYEDLQNATEPGLLFALQVVLSTIVACVGILQDDTAVVVGAMVIAPLLGPNVALGFGATLGDLAFIRRALTNNLLGVGIAAVIAWVTGSFVSVDPSVATIASRIHPGLGNVVLALTAGVAGTLAVTSGMGTALIGVMVAVALLPPLVVAGLLAGAGYGWGAAGAATLLTINVICVNLASVATFVLLGIRPRAWWDIEGAHRTSRAALLVWAGALTLILLGLLLESVL